MDTNRDSARQSQNEDYFLTFLLGNKWQTGLFQPSKVGLKFSVLKLLNVKLEHSTEILK